VRPLGAHLVAHPDPAGSAAVESRDLGNGRSADGDHRSDGRGFDSPQLHEDWITGGAGRDFIISAGGGADIVLSSPGRDRIIADATDIVPSPGRGTNCTIADTGEPCHPDESDTEVEAAEP
jgi:hypothetical protein